MDDRAPQEVQRGDSPGVIPDATPQSWSCVDYVDKGAVDNVNDRRKRYAAAPEKVLDGLKRRFGELEGHDDIEEDTSGSCTQMTLTHKNGRLTDENGACTHARTSQMVMELAAGGGPREIRKQLRMQWYTGKQTNRGWPGTAEGKINTAQGMAGDLVSNLSSEEKETVAGILTGIVSGGEVVEVNAVTTTSVMANVCYDLEHPVLVPFGCVGLGANVVSVSDGHADAKLAYRLQGGLSYYVAPRITAFVSGYYHKILGEGEYTDIPMQHLSDDQSPEGRSKRYARAKFKMAYTGAEIGVRVTF